MLVLYIPTSLDLFRTVFGNFLHVLKYLCHNFFFTMTEAQLKLNQLLPAQCSGSSCEQDNCWCKIKLRVET